MSEKKFDPSETIGFYITLCWLAFWGGILYIGLQAKVVNLGDLGAFISGIFAPVAWLWFYLSYRLQRNELKLQRQALDKQVEELEFTREEISLQRQALEHQVIAQQGSEQALRKQSEAMTQQLEMTQTQFLYNQKVLAGQLPLFELIGVGEPVIEGVYPLNGTGINAIFRCYQGQKENIENPSFSKVSFKFYVRNIAGNCTLKKVEIKNSNTESISFCNLRLNHNKDDAYEIDFDINSELFKGGLYFNPEEIFQLVHKHTNHLTFNFYYSYGDTSGMDTYVLNRGDDTYTFIKVKNNTL